MQRWKRDAQLKRTGSAQQRVNNLVDSVDPCAARKLPDTTSDQPTDYSGGHSWLSGFVPGSKAAWDRLTTTSLHFFSYTFNANEALEREFQLHQGIKSLQISFYPFRLATIIIGISAVWSLLNECSATSVYLAGAFIVAFVVSLLQGLFPKLLE
jgi:hypothetical protein